MDSRDGIPGEMLNNEIEAGHGTQTICMEMSARAFAGINREVLKKVTLEAMGTCLSSGGLKLKLLMRLFLRE